MQARVYVIDWDMGPVSVRLVRDRISRADLTTLAESLFGDMVKAVVDIERGVMAVGGELHADEEALLLDDGSVQGNVWGINMYPAARDEGFLEFDSMINVRPSRGNPSRDVTDERIRTRIREVVSRLVSE